MVDKNRLIVACIATAVIIGSLLLLVLLPISFGYLDYFEYGFARRRTTGQVDTSHVFAGGRYLIGPDFHFKIFYAAAQFVAFRNIPIFTADNLEVTITVDLQYFLIKEDLKLLHDSYDIYYHTIITNNAKDALKNSVAGFNTSMFISDRNIIQNELFEGVRMRLNGKCCLPKCKQLKECPKCKLWELCQEGCKPRTTCNKEDKGFFVEVRYLQLHDIEIPNQVNERKLTSLIKDLEKEKEESIKNEKLVRDTTSVEVANIRNSAKQIVANASAISDYLLNKAEVDYSRIIERVHNEGLKRMYNELGFSSPKHKSSLNYLNSLRYHEKIKYSIDFNTLVATTK